MTINPIHIKCQTLIKHELSFKRLWRLKKQLFIRYSNLAIKVRKGMKKIKYFNLNKIIIILPKYFVFNRFIFNYNV